MYISELAETLVSFLNDVHDNNAAFQQDNARMYSSKQ